MLISSDTRDIRREQDRPTLLIATTSVGKLREWQQILQDLDLQQLSLSDVGISFDVEENGVTFAENAAIKAHAYGDASGLLTLAEDSGLAVSALGGAPGVYSARWGGDDYLKKNQLLVDLLVDKRGAERACRYVCVVALRHPDGRLWKVRGEVRGRIAERPAGSGGFGYDPVFLIPRLKATLGEIPDAVKNQISHRGRAAKRVRPLLSELLQRDGLSRR